MCSIQSLQDAFQKSLHYKYHTAGEPLKEWAAEFELVDKQATPKK
jgi:hypothetical protein